MGKYKNQVMGKILSILENGKIIKLQGHAIAFSFLIWHTPWFLI
jgi:hypothetical protein